jgi:hypothetical protein
VHSKIASKQNRYKSWCIPDMLSNDMGNLITGLTTENKIKGIMGWTAEVSFVLFASFRKIILLTGIWQKASKISDKESYTCVYEHIGQVVTGTGVNPTRQIFWSVSYILHVVIDSALVLENAYTFDQWETTSCLAKLKLNSLINDHLATVVTA